MNPIKQTRIDQLSVRVFDTREAMGACAGAEAAQAIREVLEEKEYANVMFAAAPSQNETLATLCASEGIDWSRVNAFHMDEYIGLDPAHPAGFRNFLKRAIFDRFPFASVHLLNGNAEDPAQEALRYEALLREYPLDVCLLGIGENGHIAFNDPPVADFEDPHLVKIVELEERCRQQQVNDGCFSSIDQVPTHALSVTIPGMMSAKQLFCSVPAATKAEAVERLMNGPVSTVCPATIMRRHPRAELYLDRDAGRAVLC